MLTQPHRYAGPITLDTLPDLIAHHSGAWAGMRMADDDGDGGDDPTEVDIPGLGKVTRNADGTIVLSQEKLNKVVGNRAKQSADKAQRDLAEELGYDSVEAMKSDAERRKSDAEKAKTEEQKRADALEKRERDAEARERQAAARERVTTMTRILVRAGVKDPDGNDSDDDTMGDALVLLGRMVDADADDDGIRDAAKKLKERRPELFATTAEQGPAGGGGFFGGGPGPGSGTKQKITPGSTPGSRGLAAAEARFGKRP